MGERKSKTKTGKEKEEITEISSKKKFSIDSAEKIMTLRDIQGRGIHEREKVSESVCVCDR